ncbi:2,3-bisphosphoglycerate-independent phosphoglycerate mutase [[Mycoplasma] gypis]|uniref:2,3-bisphosphoglycerate-independent phosphoglycerate mutase n=1 Tax=[Mycoplasma] gypis TaxID=92404 RepID=A0ABZ2RQP2_9BACT|nr:2,3-bisphosphoglycerate-independent phosphoglycerate mutase [[Mycoplasma] gypis]MBN0919590.1 2,3-bisphosphoglycerate-independent phosphoglycerate mutase [[Mycoplasma] gypis]
MDKKQKIILTIIDGLGLRKETQGNGFALAKHPTFDCLFNEYPNSIIQASGKFVGLPEGQIGNSEVGHLNIGAGRIVYTGLSLINKDIEDNNFKNNAVLLDAINNVKSKQTTLHVMGMLSDGGVHSLDTHLFEILKMCHANQLKNVSVHIFGDGRDTKPQSISNSLKTLEKISKDFQYPISSVSGRFYAMDRDKMFDRVELAYEALLGNSENKYTDVNQYIQSQYEQNIYDEFFVPAINENGTFIKDNDSIIFFNFRPDRARQLTHFFIGSDLYTQKPSKSVHIDKFVSMMKYEGLKTNVAFEEMKVNNPLGEVFEANNLHQLRLAETQKYAHVTFFFDGGVDKEYKNEQRILVDSLKVESYADAPQMSAKEITDQLLLNIEKNDVVIMNYANPDMVGHTGNLQATIKAVEILDSQFKRILEYVENNTNVTWFITADHGNAELTEDSDNKPATKHTTSPVMLISTDKNIKLGNGSLCDVAPTILEYLNIDQPKEMTGKSLLIKSKNN